MAKKEVKGHSLTHIIIFAILLAGLAYVALFNKPHPSLLENAAAVPEIKNNQELNKAADNLDETDVDKLDAGASDDLNADINEAADSK